MGKKIYLFELDSVRQTDAEVRQGLFALYEEIFYNGNTVVISFNQLVDSRLFLSLLKDDDHYQNLRKLFQKGLLIISRYGTFRTASQYVQSAIQKNLAKNGNAFIFSALPVKTNQKYLLKLMLRALINSDLSELTAYLDDKRAPLAVISIFDEVTANGSLKERTLSYETAQHYLIYIKRFLELILVISVSEQAYNPARSDNSDSADDMTLIKRIDLMMRFDFKAEFGDLWGHGIECLQTIKMHLNSTNENNRSMWLKALKTMSKDKVAMTNACAFAEVLVNLCYNYTVEASIVNVSRHYRLEDFKSESYGLFREDFLNRLMMTWDDGQDAHAKYLKDESNTFHVYGGEQPNWKVGSRIVDRMAPAVESQTESQDIPLYEQDFKLYRKQWVKRNQRRIFEVLWTTLLYLFLLILANIVLSAFQNEVGIVINSILTILGFMILSEIVCNLFKLPSVFDSFNALQTCFVDFYVISRKQKPVAYKHDFELGAVTAEKPSEVKAEYTYETDMLKGYTQLWHQRPALFTASDVIDIVDPRTVEGKKCILDYEIRHDVHIGLLYESPYNMWVVDLIQNPDGSNYTYERLIPKVATGAVVIIARYQDKYVLLNQFRHALRAEQLAFPRGYGDVRYDGSDLPAAENVIKEMSEELRAKIVGAPVYIGEIIADSGISGNRVSAYAITLDYFEECRGYEGIQRVCLKTAYELENSIRTGEITDGYTLSGYMLYKCHVQAPVA